MRRFALLLALVGCDDAEPGDCSAEDDAAVACDPLYTPTFDEVHARTLAPSCAVGGGACHGSEGGQGGLVLATVGDAYRGLVEAGRVVPGSPGCSALAQRIDASGGALMPPGAQLSEAERCSVRQWIANGAER